MTRPLAHTILLLAAFMSGLIAGVQAFGGMEHPQEFIFLQETSSDLTLFYVVDQGRGLTVPFFDAEIDLVPDSTVSFSPDGRFMIVPVLRDGPYAMLHDLERESSGWLKVQHDLVRPAVESLLWSSDSRTLVYPIGMTSVLSSLLVLDPDSWQMRAITTDPIGFLALSWQQSSRVIWAYQSHQESRPISALYFRRQGNDQLTGTALTFDLDTGATRSIDVTPACYPRPTPTITFDGLWMACLVMPTESGSNDPRIYVYELAEEAQEIQGMPVGEENVGIVEWLEWSPDGRKISYFTSRDRSKDLYVLDLVTGTEAYIMKHREANVVPLALDFAAWSPDSGHIAISSYRETTFDLFLYELGAGQLSRLTDAHTLDLHPQWSSNGAYLSFIRLPNAAWNHYQPTTTTEEFGLYVITVEDKSMRPMPRPIVRESEVAIWGGWRP